jgi:asparagine synthase (glutamine-hydrolysing)
LPQLCQWLDEPFGDASVLPTFLLSQFAREHVTVALGGDGADELLAGYPTFSAEPWLLRFQKLPRFAQQMVGQLVSHLPVRHTNFSFDFKARQFLKGAGASPCLSHQRWLGSFSEAEIQKLITFDRCPSIEMNFVKQLEKEWSLGMSEQDKRLIQYQTTYLPEDILFKVDRASMATSLEVRAPFLDTELVDWLAKQPYSAKREGGQGKQILKKALQRRIPDSILKRPKKGFGIPVAAWLRGPLKGWMTDLLAADRLNQQGLFLPSYVAQMIDQHLKGQVDYRKPLWTLLIFQIWYDYWINGNSHTH